MYLSHVPDSDGFMRNATQFTKKIGGAVFDPNLRTKLWDVETARATLLDFAAESDIILPGVAEGEFLFGESDPHKLGQITFKSWIISRCDENGCLKEGGVKVLEITVETPGACAAIEKVSLEFDDVLVGAGTVLDPETARIEIMSGAKFVFSPTTNLKTIEMAKRYGVVSIPGALTPNEMLTAFESGADLIKVFPANVFGRSYIKDIHGPIPQIPLITTGGISVDNVGDYIKAGVVGVGVVALW